MRWILLGLRRTVDFRGRSSRREFCWHCAFCLIAQKAICYGIDGIRLSMSPGHPRLYSMVIIVPYICHAVIALSLVAVAVRRMHDVEMGGLWLLLPVLGSIGGPGPLFIGTAILLCIFLKKGDAGENKFGLPQQAETEICQEP